MTPTTRGAKRLKEQHRNTRHDAVEKLTEIRAKYADGYSFPPAAEAMFNEMCGAIMNLKQREPKNGNTD